MLKNKGNYRLQERNQEMRPTIQQIILQLMFHLLQILL